MCYQDIEKLHHTKNLLFNPYNVTGRVLLLLFLLI